MTRELANFLGALLLTLFFGGVGVWGAVASVKTRGSDWAFGRMLVGVGGFIPSLLFAGIPAFLSLTQCLPSGVAR